MEWLVLIGIIAAIVFALRSRQGIRVLARIWVVISIVWIGAFYLSVGSHIGQPGYMGFRAATEWALIPPAVALVDKI